MTDTYRLGLDIGANSIGWCALDLNSHGQPYGLRDLGLRVYPDGRNPKDGSSLAAQRRLPRSMRRNRDRFLQRRRNLLNALIRFGLMPPEASDQASVARRNPYKLRAEALTRRLDPYELGRVLFHINQHRGFRSNRKTDRESNESSLITHAASRTRADLHASSHLTLGSWLAERHAEKRGVRVRLAGAGKTAEYPFYPLRDMLEHEFDTVWQAQSDWTPSLTPAMGDALRKIIFFQRPLKQAQVGRCWLEPAEFRGARALPTSQRFRIAQSLSHLRISRPGEPDAPLTAEQRDVLTSHLYLGKNLSLDRVRRLLRLPPEADFNTREEMLNGCATSDRLGNGRGAPIGPAWHRLSLPVQDKIVTTLLDADTDDLAVGALVAAGITREAAERAGKCSLPDGHTALSAKAMAAILPHMEAGAHYADAVKLAGYAHHSDRRTGECRDRLPYYGELLFDRMGTGTGEPCDPQEKRLGRAPNPTVHVALNEIRRVVNAILEQHGPPAEIVIETLRDLGRSKKQREEYEKEQKKNRTANDDRRKILAGLGLPPNSRNLMRLRLWQDQARDPKNRVCPYTGALITPVTALSDAVEVDHILPFALTLDDSVSNRMLVAREANRAKARRSPAEAFSHQPEWPMILERAALLPPSKRWRFQPDAMERFARDGDFLARHLSDSATIALWTKAYLDVLAPGKVWTTPGRLTALLRHSLGLNSATVLGKGGHRKDRTDHRHHAIDAVVVALTDRSLLKRMTDAAKRAEDRGEKLIADLQAPWPDFVVDIAARASDCIVSFKPDTGWQAALHNDTAYGALRQERSNGHNVVVRRPLDSLADWTPEQALESVADPVLASRIAGVLRASPDAGARKAALASMRHSAGAIVRSVRATERLQSFQPIADRRTGRPYKVVKRDGNHRAELWRLPDGQPKLVIISTFDAAQQAEAARLGRAPADLRPHPAAKLIMRLHKNDMLTFCANPQSPVMRVVKMSGGSLTLAAHNEAGALKRRDADKQDAFKYVSAGATRLMAERARKVQVLPDGRRRWASGPS